MRFAGYAAIFGRRDRGGDIIARGAFADSLRRRHAAGEAMPLLWCHDPDQPIGVVERMAEDGRGLRVIGRLTERGARAGEAMRRDGLDGLSFGYRVVAAATSEGMRRLETLDIVEVSLVPHPMQPLARVHAVED